MEKYDVFISYSRADYKDANNVPIPGNVISKITTELHEQNITFWIDEDGIYTGDNFAPKIAKAIESSQVFVFVSSENSNKSPWTQNEVCVAQSYKKPILPLKCDDSTYAVSVIMYLAMLDYCDYKSLGDRAITQLVESIKEKLPPKSQVDDTKVLQQNDREYKKAILSSLDEINHQIVDISQIAVGQVLEANQRNREALYEIEGVLKGVSLEITENRDKVGHQIIDRIERNFHELIHTAKENNHELCSRIEHLISIAEESRQFTKKVIGMFEEFLEASQKNYEAKQSDDQSVVNIIFVCDVSGSMAGEKIVALNDSIQGFTHKVINGRNRNDILFNVEVLSYSTEAEWQTFVQYSHYCRKDICLEAQGLTSLGAALELLNKKTYALPTKNKTFIPLLIFISDGAPTDNWNQSFHSISSNHLFIESYKRAVALGDDADVSILNEITSNNVNVVNKDYHLVLEKELTHIYNAYCKDILLNKLYFTK